VFLFNLVVVVNCCGFSVESVLEVLSGLFFPGSLVGMWVYISVVEEC